jgi:Smg protein
MKDNLFEMLLNLFEKTLTQLKESHELKGTNGVDDKQADVHGSSQTGKDLTFVKAAHPDSIRVFTYDEQMKLTKASYQFLMRITSWGVVTSDVFELVLNQLIFSESRFVTLQETKWSIRNTLANSLDAEQLAFLDLVLYHKEDQLPLH